MQERTFILFFHHSEPKHLVAKRHFQLDLSIVGLLVDTLTESTLIFEHFRKKNEVHSLSSFEVIGSRRDGYLNT